VSGHLVRQHAVLQGTHGKGRGSAKTDAKIVAHVLATEPNSYDLVTMLVLGKDLTNKEIMKFTREQYRSYRKQHFEKQNTRRNRRYNNAAAAYTVEATHNSEVNFVAGGQQDKGSCPVVKLGKKFKGFCKDCGIQGHKVVNCHVAKKKIIQVKKENFNEKLEIVFPEIRQDN
jgi:hypothetical protein